MLLPDGFLKRFVALGCVCIALGLCLPTPAETVPELASRLTGLSKVHGGLCVHVGCGDGTLTAELAGGRFLVQGIDSDPEQVSIARAHLRTQGLYGLATAERHSLTTLPYAENLVNLIVVDNVLAHDVPLAEIMRILCPGGVALVGQSTRHGKSIDRDATLLALRGLGLGEAELVEEEGIWVRIEKPLPTDHDEWTHVRYGPENNPVSQDLAVGPPRRVRWLGSPGHEAGVMLSAQGRNFYGGVHVRDAFNGLLLWQKNLRKEDKPAEGAFFGDRALTRPVVNGDRLFVMTNRMLRVLDAATGAELDTYPEAGTPTEIRHIDDYLLCTDEASLRVLNAEDGTLLWLRKATLPDCVTTGEGSVFYAAGNVRRGEPRTAYAVDLRTGKERWRRKTASTDVQDDSYNWLAYAGWCAYRDGVLAFESSSYSDVAASRVCAVSAATGDILWSHEFESGMSHYKQARVCLTDGLVWIMKESAWVGLNPRSGEEVRRYKTVAGHCFPPVATEQYFLSGEMSLTAVKGGEVISNRITKATCGRDMGLMPANGLIYTSPKGCICFPMLKGFAALAPASTQPAPAQDGIPVPTPGAAPSPSPTPPAENEWPAYRANVWRSASTAMEVPDDLAILWQRDVVPQKERRTRPDWSRNPFSSGAITAPVAASGVLVVAQADGQCVNAFDSRSGQPRWTFTANGRIDTAPTLHEGLCLFGTRSGWVYALDARTGGLIWQLHAAPGPEQIVAFGQIESPWPVPGSILVSEGIAYFTAGRHFLADGGIRLYAVEPATGKVLWTERISELPDHHYYASSGLEFDDFDLLVREGDAIMMSRWRINPETHAIDVLPKSGFGFFSTGEKSVMSRRGLWTYGPSSRIGGSAQGQKKRALAAFRENRLYNSTDDMRSFFRRDFDVEGGEVLDSEWYSKRNIILAQRAGREVFATRNQVLANNSAWSASPFDESDPGNKIAAMVLAGNKVLIAGMHGGLTVLSAETGEKLEQVALPTPLWDGMAAAYGRVYVSTTDGRLICLGKPSDAL